MLYGRLADLYPATHADILAAADILLPVEASTVALSSIEAPKIRRLQKRGRKIYHKMIAGRTTRIRYRIGKSICTKFQHYELASADKRCHRVIRLTPYTTGWGYKQWIPTTQ